MKSGKVIVFAIALAALAASCAPKAPAKAGASVVVFVPGAVAGNPIYEQLVAGAKRAVAESKDAKLQVIEAGFNQAEWPEKVKTLAASGNFDFIVTSNTAMPEICAEAGKAFPAQKFIVVDGWLEGNPAIHASLYNQVEQGYFAGYLAGLTAKHAGKAPKFGVVAAQTYPALDESIIPGFLSGARAAYPGSTVEVRIVGNWYDANKGAELAASLFDSGCEVILPVAGGAGQGVVSAAKERGKKIVWLDSSGYGIAPGTIIGCATLAQEKLVHERVKAALEGKLAFGEAKLMSAKDGWVDFDDTAAEYSAANPEPVRTAMAAMLKAVRSGTLSPEPAKP